MSELKMIPVKEIRENPVALRNVNRTSEGYIGLVDSVRQKGVLNAISVREIRDPESGKTLYGLIDGLHRFSAACDAGLESVPAQVTAMSDADVLEAQLIANVHKIETKPVEYSKQLMRVLMQNPLLTTAELCKRLSKSSGWLNERLGLVKLTEAIAKLVDEGKINLSNAYALAKLPDDEQPNFVDRAMTMSPQEFLPTAHARAKQIRDDKRKGRDTSPAEFTPVAHLRKIAEIKDEMENPKVAPVLVHELKIPTPVAGFLMGVKWALHMDPKSVEAQRAKDVARKAEAEEKKNARKAEREKQKQTEAAQAVAEVTANG